MDDKIIQMCEIGDLEIVKNVITDCDINIRYKIENIYILSCYYGHTQIIKYLFENNKLINITDVFNVHASAIINVCRSKKIGVISFLLDYIIQNDIIDIHTDNEIIFRTICTDCNIEIVKYVIEYCEKIDNLIDIHVLDDIIFIDACYAGRLDIIKCIMEYDDRHNDEINIHKHWDKAIRIVLDNGHIDIINYFIEYYNKTNRKINIYVNEEYMFLKMCCYCRIDTLKYLIEYSILHNNEIYIHICDELGFRQACTYNNFDIVKYLIEYCEKINKKINIHADQEHVFIWLNINKNITIIKYLLYLNKHNYGTFDKTHLNYISKAIARQLYIKKYVNKYMSKFIINNNILEFNEVHNTIIGDQILNSIGNYVNIYNVDYVLFLSISEIND